MAIYTGGMRQQDEARKAAKSIAAQQAKAQRGEAKRKGRAGMFGTLGGLALGTLAVGALGLTGGLAAPLVMGLSSSLSKKWADEASKKGVFKTPGQVGKIEATGKYGYGREQAAEATKALRESRKTEFDLGTIATDVGSAYLTAGMSGKLGGAKGLLKGDLSLGQALTTGSEEAWKFGGVEGAKESLLGLIPGATGAEKAVDPSTIDLEASLEGSGLDLEQYNRMKDTAQANYMDDADDWFGGGSPQVDFQSEYEDFLSQGSTEVPQFDFAQGGQVPQQQQLMALLALSQMQQQQEQTAYSGTSLEEEKQPSIADYFASQGKTLGGNNTQSLSQILGR